MTLLLLNCFETYGINDVEVPVSIVLFTRNNEILYDV